MEDPDPVCVVKCVEADSRMGLSTDWSAATMLQESGVLVSVVDSVLEAAHYDS